MTMLTKTIIFELEDCGEFIYANAISKFFQTSRISSKFSKEKISSLKKELLSAIDVMYKTDIINLKTLRDFVKKVNSAETTKEFEELILETNMSKKTLKKIGVSKY